MRRFIATITGLTLALFLLAQAPLPAKENVSQRVAGKPSPQPRHKRSVAARNKVVRKSTTPSTKHTGVKPRETTRIVKTVIPPGLDLTKLQTTSAGVSCGPYLGSLAEAESFVDAIVLGTPTVAYSRRDHYAAYNVMDSPDSASPLMSGAWSIGTFRIDRVLYQKNQAGQDALTDGQSISVSEPVGIILQENRYASITVADITELKQNSKYVLFLRKHRSPDYQTLYVTCNRELGRFNTDGTDPEKEPGLYTWKQLLREELVATYNVPFVPVYFAPSEARRSSP